MSYFKVVSVEGRKLFSAVACPGIRVRYQAGEWNYPVIPNSKLFVFDDYDVALRWAMEYFNDSNKFRIYACEVSNPRRIQIVGKLCYDAVDANRFWNERGGKKFFKSNYLVNYPDNTIGCDAIFLNERIKYDHRF
jgi:hypothetical protein